MHDNQGESVRRLESLGVRVRFVPKLSEGAIYFRKFGLAVLDEGMTRAESNGLLVGIIDEVKARRDLAELHHHLSKRGRLA